MYERVYVCA